MVLKLAKKKEPADSTPKVSKLPLPISDSPLVIDLPDGQKIVVGKMTSGSVIEVATWRGVGRPDSRTSRLMLGVGSGKVEDEQKVDEEVTKREIKPTGAKIILFYLNIFISLLAKINVSKIFSKLIVRIKSSRKNRAVNKPEGTAAIAPATPSTALSIGSPKDSTSADTDLEEWLNRISQKASESVARANKKGATNAKSSKNVRKAAPKSARATTKKR